MWRNLLVSLTVAMLTGAAWGQEPARATDELSALRMDLAQTKLKLQAALAELEKLKAFLAEKNLDERLAQWQAERQLLVEERLRLQRERSRLEQARRQLGQAASLKIQREAQQREEAERRRQEALKPNWSIQYMLGYISTDNETYYTRVTSNGQVYLRRRLDNIDTRNVKVKGTVLNRSEAPWRYTFEIRLGGEAQNLYSRESAVMGKWRVQTPLLGPGDLHEFEVIIPVRNAYSVDTVQIGNITADRPAQLVPVPAPGGPGSPKAPAQPATTPATLEAYAP